MTEPLPPQFTVQMTLFLGPLQEDKEKAANKRTRRRALLRFIWHPTTDSSTFSITWKGNTQNPHSRMYRGVRREGIIETARVFNC